MNLYISGMFLYPGKVGGAEQHFYNLLKGFRAIGRSGQIEVGVQQGASGRMDPVLDNFRVRKEAIILNRVVNDCLYGTIGNRAEFPSHALFPNYVPPLFPPTDTRIFTTIYDLLYKSFPDVFSRGKRIWLQLAHRLAIRNSHRVIVLSNFVKRDLLQNYPRLHADQVDVIHAPIDFSRFEGNSRFSGRIGAPYILAVANLYPHKNLHTLIRAYLKLYPRSPRPFKLVLAGQLGKNLRGGDFSHYARKIEEMLQGNPDIHQTGYISDQDLGDLYRNATLFCFPSIFEGFGMPVVEAMGFALPTITTSLTSLPEVSLNQALYVESACDPDAWATKMKITLENIEEERSRLALLQNTVRSTYDPASIGRQYWNVFEST